MPTFLLYLHQFMLVSLNILSTQIIVIELYVEHMVVTMLVLWVTLLVLKLFVNLQVLWAVINLFIFSHICISETVRCSVSCKSVSVLISSEPVKSFVSCKPVCFSNVSMAKEFDSVNYYLVTCTEHPVNVISSVVRKSLVSYRIAYPVDFDIVAETINVTLLFIYRCVSSKILHRIIPTVISILDLPSYSARSSATLSVYSSP